MYCHSSCYMSITHGNHADLQLHTLSDRNRPTGGLTSDKFAAEILYHTHELYISQKAVTGVKAGIKFSNTMRARGGHGANCELSITGINYVLPSCILYLCSSKRCVEYPSTPRGTTVGAWGGILSPESRTLHLPFSDPVRQSALFNCFKCRSPIRAKMSSPLGLVDPCHSPEITGSSDGQP